MSTKQVIVVRRDLNMPPGKLAAQVAHASMAFMGRQIQEWFDQYEGYTYHPGKFGVELTAPQCKWFDSSYAKVVLGVDDEAELKAIADYAERGGLATHRIIDDGRTVFNGVPTFTCVGIGPDYNEVIDVVTGKLRLY